MHFFVNGYESVLTKLLYPGTFLIFSYSANESKMNLFTPLSNTYMATLNKKVIYSFLCFGAMHSC